MTTTTLMTTRSFVDIENCEADKMIILVFLAAICLSTFPRLTIATHKSVEKQINEKNSTFLIFFLFFCTSIYTKKEKQKM